MVSFAADGGAKLRLTPAKPIIGPVADAIVFWGAPVLALVFGFVVSFLPAETNSISVLQKPALLTALFAAAVTEAHLVIVAFRSHANANIFKRFPLRFTVVPACVFIAMVASPSALLLLTTLALLWDAYHTAMQSFGLARIYDARAGGDPTRDRRVDMAFHIAVYTVPWVIGPVFAGVLPAFEQMWNADIKLFDPLIRFRLEHAAAFEASVWIIVPVAVIAYAARQVQRALAGEPIAWQKIALSATTTAVSVWCFTTGFFGQALLVVNLFHAVQYFAIVHATEKKNVAGLVRVAPPLLAILVVGVVYGVGIGALGKYWVPTALAATLLFAFRTTVSLMHFWYDGFIWSVRKKDV